MIRATIKLVGFFIDKPKYYHIDISENDVAMEKKNETTNRYETVTVGRLFDIYKSKGSYLKSQITKEDKISGVKQDAPDPEDHLTRDYFETWFREKHLKGKSWETTILSIDFTQI